MTAVLGDQWSAAHLDRILPPGKTRYPFYRRLGGPQGRSGRAENLVPTGIRSRTVQPVVSRYTDWANRTLPYRDIHKYQHCFLRHPQPVSPHMSNSQRIAESRREIMGFILIWNLKIRGLKEYVQKKPDPTGLFALSDSRFHTMPYLQFPLSEVSIWNFE